MTMPGSPPVPVLVAPPGRFAFQGGDLHEHAVAVGVDEEGVEVAGQQELGLVEREEPNACPFHHSKCLPGRHWLPWAWATTVPATSRVTVISSVSGT
jgi:hypothetical protein